jgi:serine/threonine protein phosphatase 1
MSDRAPFVLTQAMKAEGDAVGAAAPREGVCRGAVVETDVELERPIDLAGVIERVGHLSDVARAKTLGIGARDLREPSRDRIEHRRHDRRRGSARDHRLTQSAFDLPESIVPRYARGRLEVQGRFLERVASKRERPAPRFARTRRRESRARRSARRHKWSNPWPRLSVRFSVRAPPCIPRYNKVTGKRAMQKTFIIGDIHACYAELMELLDRAAIGDGDLVVSVGDLVDRGPEPEAVLDLFRTRKEAIVLCGNHERKHIRRVLSYSQQVTKEQLGDRYDEHVRWMSSLPYHWERADVRVVHFGLFPGVPLADVPEDVRAGTTSGEARLKEKFGDRSWWDVYEDDTPVVFGHRVVGPEPLVIRDRIFGIDTGACHGMRLTGLLLPEMRLVSVPAREDHWKRVRAEWQAPVLRSLDWSRMTFEQIERKLKSLRDRDPIDSGPGVGRLCRPGTPGPELGDEVLDRIRAWAESLLGAIPELRQKLDAEVARLVEREGEGFGRAAADHPAGNWMLRRHAGRLSPERLGCATPDQLVALAKALGVPLEANPL